MGFLSRQLVTGQSLVVTRMWLYLISSTHPIHRDPGFISPIHIKFISVHFEPLTYDFTLIAVLLHSSPQPLLMCVLPPTRHLVSGLMSYNELSQVPRDMPPAVQARLSRGSTCGAGTTCCCCRRPFHTVEWLVHFVY